jgi:uncharacterized iron-regulated membrane protein
VRAWLLKLHRWVALAFALPLIVIIGTGLILSAEPWLVEHSIEPHSLTTAGIERLLQQYDASGQARSLVYRSYDKTLTIGAGRGGGTVVDAATGETRSGPSLLANTLLTARRMHESLLLKLGGVVVGSTTAMLLLVILGVLMGWPRFANSPSGWHKAMAWGLLPLIVLSPLSGLLMAAGITFTSAPDAPPARAAPMPLVEAVRIIGRDHDLSSLVSMRPLGGRLVARLVEDGEYVTYVVTREGSAAMPRNWPRLWHEGNFAGALSALTNLVISFAMSGLVVTGVWIWLRRQLRRRARRIQQVVPA